MATNTPPTLSAALDRLADVHDRGFRFMALDGSERFYAFGELVAAARVRGAAMVAEGLEKGDSAAIVIPDPAEFVLNFLGAVSAGIWPVPIFPPASFKALENYQSTLSHIIEASRAKLLVTDTATKPLVEPVLEQSRAAQQAKGDTPSLRAVRTAAELVASGAPAFTAPNITPSDLCFLQFTSGSTSTPKGVMVTHGNLVANSSAFLGPHGLDRRAGDLGVSWLPLYHDMGLIGFVLGTLVCDIPVVLLPTNAFARRPLLWLETISKYRGTITYAPNFAYALVSKRARDISGLDLSSLRVAGCGAEPIHAATLRAFADRFAPAGFNANAFLPSYGMAEATLAITFHQLGSPMRTVWVDNDELARGSAVDVPPGSPRAVELVSCGITFPGHNVKIIDEHGAALPERKVGEICARGASITSGYYQNIDASKESWDGEWLRSGDLGFTVDGNLYICGRIKDLIILKGANYYPQDIEWIVGALPGVRRGNVVAFSTEENDEEKLVVVAEALSAEADGLRQQIPASVSEALGIPVHRTVLVSQGTLPKTSSGKPQRRKTKSLFLADQLEELA